jgi:acyl-CoA thioesterase
MEVQTPADLRTALALTPVPARPGLYRGELDRSWSFIIPSGGVLTSLALAAMRLDLLRLGGTHLVPSGATATFCSAVAEGPLDVEVTVLRHGKTATQMRANVRPRGQGAAPGDVGLEVVATWVEPRTNDAFPPRAWVPTPDFPMAAEAEIYDPSVTGITPPPFYRNLEVRRAKGDVWWKKTWGPGEPHVARWYRYLVPPAMPGEDGRLDPLALPPIADTMASAVHQALGSQEPPLLFPSLDLTVHFTAPRSGVAERPLLVDCYATSIYEGTATARGEVWQDGILLATATQTMTLRTIKSR